MNNTHQLYVCPWQACIDDARQEKLIGHTMVEGEVDPKPLQFDVFIMTGVHVTSSLRDKFQNNIGERSIGESEHKHSYIF